MALQETSIHADKMSECHALSSARAPVATTVNCQVTTICVASRSMIQEAPYSRSANSSERPGLPASNSAAGLFARETSQCSGKISRARSDGGSLKYVSFGEKTSLLLRLPR